ncbi:MAG: hypothetical protein ABIQ93_03630 [Saprospiraceae bacterium]
MKLLTLLQALQPDEYKDFEKFLQSPFFKDSEQYRTFFRYLYKQHPMFDLESAGLRDAYRNCFGAQSLTDTKLHNLGSGLSKQLEQYLVVRMALPAKEGPKGDFQDQLLVKSLGLRNMGDYFRKEAQELIDAIAARPVIETDDYLAIQQLHYHVYFNPDTTKSQGASILQAAADHLDLYYCLAKLRYAAEMKTGERIYNDSYEQPLLAAVLERCQAPGMIDKHPLLRVYYQLVNLYLREVDEPGFRELKRTFTTFAPTFSKEDQSGLLRHLINCGIYLHARDSNVEGELLELYKLALETGQLIDGNRMTFSTFINIANLAILRQEFDWVEGFITQYSSYLEDIKRKPVVALAMAGLYHAQGRLDAAQACLRDEKIYQIPLFEFLAKDQLLKILFDRYVGQGEDYEFLIGYIRSYVRFVRTKALPADKLAARLNWIRMVRRMAILKFELVTVPESKKVVLRRTLARLIPALHRKWLQAKIDAL